MLPPPCGPEKRIAPPLMRSDRVTDLDARTPNAFVSNLDLGRPDEKPVASGAFPEGDIPPNIVRVVPPNGIVAIPPRSIVDKNCSRPPVPRSPATNRWPFGREISREPL